ncbi:MAG: hypothetical protein AB8I08_39295 [Sandaracinaceae bacterium]
MTSMGKTASWMLALALVGCGGGEPADEPPPEGTTGGEQADVLPSPPSPWEEMAHADQAAWMGAEVLPRMATRFQEYDSERYADFSCATCHGPGAAEGEFEMPSLSLPALPATGTPEQHAMVRTYPEGTRFMFSNVLPAMQTLLGAPDFDEATGEGFSCFACHPHAGDEGATLIRLDMPEEQGEDGV